MEYKTACGCIVVSSPPNFDIKYCPLHGAAPDLYEACKQALRTFEAHGIKAVDPRYLIIKQAIAKVEGDK